MGCNTVLACFVFKVPRLVESLKEEVCIQLTAARDHTMFLTQRLVSAGLNFKGNILEIQTDYPV